MEILWQTLGRGRDRARERAASVVRRSREAGAGLLGRVEGGAEALRQSLAARRDQLNGNAAERVERRVLTRLELVLGRLGLDLRTQIHRLTPPPTAPAMQPDAPQPPADAELVADEETPARTPAARAQRKKATSSSRATTAARERASSNGTRASKRTTTAKQKTKKTKQPSARTARASARPSASTRWVTPPSTSAVDVDALGALPVKALLARTTDLDADALRALLAHEKQTKKRKTVIDALSARLAT